MIFETYATATLNGEKVMTKADFDNFMEDLPPTRARLEHFEIRTMYKELRLQGLSQSKCIELINEKYQHLQFETIKKIMYRTGEYSTK